MTFANLPAYWNQTVGFEDTLKRLTDLANTTFKSVYPPYDIIKVDDNKYVIQLAVAGFGKQNIDIELADGKLIVAGKLDNDEKDVLNVLHKGIANRPFTRSFTLADTVVVEGAELVNGILKIWLENIIPDHKKPRKVEIADKDEKEAKPSKKTLLNE